MSDLLYNIENVFSTDPRNGVLGKNNTSKFYIPSYQRGYKWSSEGSNAWVKIMMEDFLEAFSNKDEEYLLQYITVKKRKIDDNHILEIIDGQQRITTLIILLSVLFHKISSNPNISNIAHEKLIYGIRENVQIFLEQFVFSEIRTVIENTWDEFINDHAGFNEQDIFYIFNAVKKIEQLLPIEASDLLAFEKYVKENVQLIFNVVNETIIGEKIFSNLNSNRVELTDIELIKGLILTKASREDNSAINNFKELLDLRASMGQKWDIISRWINNPRISSFFFADGISAMHQFLSLVAEYNGYNKLPFADKYALFNFFQTQVKRKSISSIKLFSDIKFFFSLLEDWYYTNEIYNRLGFLFFSDKSSRNSLIISLLDKNKLELKNELMTLAVGKIPIDIDSLEYGVDDSDINKVLLALSIFSNEKELRFNFYSFKKEKWTLEHIFPQNPSKLPDRLERNDIKLLKSLIKDDINLSDLSKYKFEDETEEKTKEIFNNLLEKLELESCDVNNREKDLLYNLIRSEKLNSIGNLVLLSDSDNSSNSNGMFDQKRNNIVKRISKGSFVPKHTYDVFSKLISSNFDLDLSVWSEKDIDAHTKWIGESINKIKTDHE